MRSCQPQVMGVRHPTSRNKHRIGSQFEHQSPMLYRFILAREDGAKGRLRGIQVDKKRTSRGRAGGRVGRRVTGRMKAKHLRATWHCYWISDFIWFVSCISKLNVFNVYDYWNPLIFLFNESFDHLTR